MKIYYVEYKNGKTLIKRHRNVNQNDKLLHNKAKMLKNINKTFEKNVNKCYYNEKLFNKFMHIAI